MTTAICKGRALPSLRRRPPTLEIYPQTRTPDAEADIAVLRRFCDFDIDDPRHAWARMELTNTGRGLRRLHGDPATAGIRFHLLVENSRNTVLVTTGSDGRRMHLQERPIFSMRETPVQRGRHDRLEAWVKRVLAAGCDPTDAPAWAYEWDGLLKAVTDHHGISAQSLLDRLDRPRFMCGADWPKARRPRGDQPRPRGIEEAPGLCMGGEVDAGRIVVTDLMLSDSVAYRRRGRRTFIVLTNDRWPRIAMNGLIGMKLTGVVDHPYLRNPGMTIRSAHHSGDSTVLAVTPPVWWRPDGAPAGFPEK